MAIKFVCEGCRSKLKVGSRKAGTETTCPTCGTAILIPTQERADALEAMRRLESEKSGDAPTPEGPFLEFQVFDDVEYTYIDDEPPLTGDKQSSMAQTVPISRFVIYTQGSLLGIVAIVCFLLGLMVGTVTNSSTSKLTAQQNCEVTGTVHYRSDNQKLPDVGTRVMLLPTDVTPDARPEVTALRPGVPAERSTSERQLMTQLGCFITEVDAVGRFRLSVDSNKSYYLFIISNHHRRRQDAKIPKNERAGMGAFFLPIEEIVEDHSYRWQEVQLGHSAITMPSILFEN